MPTLDCAVIGMLSGAATYGAGKANDLAGDFLQAGADRAEASP